MIWCWLFGHRPLVTQTIGTDLITLHDALDVPLLVVRLCHRCHALYWEPTP